MNNILSFCEISGNSVKKYEGKRKYIATGDIIENEIISFEEVDYKSKPSRANQDVELGDVLFAKMQNTKKVIMITNENVNNIYSTGFYVIKPKKNVMSEFLFWFFNSKKFNDDKDKNCKGATQKAINNEGLCKININDLPTIEEQRVIVDKLNKVQEIIDTRENQIELLDELIKSQFVKMFGNIKDSKWKKVKLENITEKITDGKHGGCQSEENSGYYFIGATEIYNDKINYENSNQITKKDFEKDYTRCDLMLDDFVIVNTGATIGKSAIVVDERCKNTLLQKSVALIRVKKEKILPIYLKYCYEAEPSLYNKGQGCARINLLLSQIRNTDIPIPPIELQNKFSEFVKQVDKQKLEIQGSLEETQKLQESLMNKYFG